LANFNVLSNHLLVSISAMLMGSRRGHISRVVTLNYDSMLEWFLSIYGFLVKTVSSLPALDGFEDVRIYHPHGYLPHPDLGEENSNFLIMSMDSIDTRLGTPGEPWLEMVRHILLTGVCLFVGLSPRTVTDRALSPLFTTTSKACPERPVGIWLVKGDKDDARAIDFQRSNIIPLYFSGDGEFPEFVLKICQSALKFIGSLK